MHNRFVGYKVSLAFHMLNKNCHQMPIRESRCFTRRGSPALPAFKLWLKTKQRYNTSAVLLCLAAKKHQILFSFLDLLSNQTQTTLRGTVNTLGKFIKRLTCIPPLKNPELEHCLSCKSKKHNILSFQLFMIL